MLIRIEMICFLKFKKSEKKLIGNFLLHNVIVGNAW